MSVMTPSVALAPIDVRLKLAVSTLLVTWALAALFIVLGWRELRAETAPGSSAAHASSVSPAAGKALAFAAPVPAR